MTLKNIYVSVQVGVSNKSFCTALAFARCQPLIVVFTAPFHLHNNHDPTSLRAKSP